ncbi:molybdenum cofactor guanylyltransferase [Desulfuromonas acetoxidans]|uniref:Probable molybdenum cofactor guanylyltransferase n=1 Tax=Desulfuromonas acetoxidans (strain DSM 684 / 11070) TaxID=281689 RepID=Q1K2F9_DESA6|nr:molybdenum cofactor guanylyltransferase [Desulfuromonas acetoxidans]EAT16480.1 molybdopterin-guanine dinucleotide biosynthesis MobB region [Desulfuromonas acetoxidans DSM 684]MBF0647028.1 molybdenum cofactor guanylyltransferase [Desulfuromonas acetoxidans]NVD24363.1 molybdenum cofactor guanylyltransferase [Desulfuromonas acetoxidans]NVE14866.1 molybdenum cofactor guanylyltransferase [Desulfuromonas acetoxidans]
MSKSDVTGIILAGGKSRRMGREKLFLDVGGQPLFERVFYPLRMVFDDILIVANDQKRFERYQVPLVSDIYPGSALGGLYSGLMHAATPWGFVCAADMPFVNLSLIRYLLTQTTNYDIVVPVSEQGVEPLFACYSKRCLPAMEQALENRQYKIIDVWETLRVCEVPMTKFRHLPAIETAFINLNREEDVHYSHQLLTPKRG